MEHSNEFQALSADPVRDDVKRAGDDKLSRARNSPRAPHARLLSNQFNAGENLSGYAGGCAGVVFRDVLANLPDVANRSGRPDGVHPRRAFCSPFLPQDRSHRATFF